MRFMRGTKTLLKTGMGSFVCLATNLSFCLCLENFQGSSTFSVRRVSLCLNSCSQITIQRGIINCKCLVNSLVWLLANSYIVN